MAMSKELEEELTCPIDLELYEEPMLLKCLHILCEKDVNHMLYANNVIKCPVCKQISNIRDIKRDFRTKRLIDLIKSDRGSKAPVNCEICEKEIGTHKCVQCNMYFGDTCKSGHSKIPVTKTHQFVTVKSLMEANKERIETFMRELDNTDSELQEIRQKWLDSKSDIEAKSLEAIKHIDSSEEQIMQEVKTTYDKMRKKVQDKVQPEVTEINKEVTELDSNIGNFQKTHEMFHDIISGDEDKSLLNDELLEELMTKSPSIHGKDYTFTGRPSVNFVIPPTDKVIQALRNLELQYATVPCSASKLDKKEHLDGTIDESKRVIPSQHISFRDYMTKGLTSKKIYQFKSEPMSMSVIGSKVWIVMYDPYIIEIVHFVKEDLVKLKTITAHRLKKQGNADSKITFWPRAVIEKDGKIIMACSGISPQNDNVAKTQNDVKDTNLGLVIINGDGLIERVIAKGKYVNVKADSHYLYGLSEHFLTIIEYQTAQKEWYVAKTINLRWRFTNLCVFGDTITLSHWLHKVIKYDLKTNIATDMCVEDGFQTWQPHVSFPDREGNVCICDRIHSRIIFLMHDDSWIIPTVDEKLEETCDAVVDTYGRLIVLCDKSVQVLL